MLGTPSCSSSALVSLASETHVCYAHARRLCCYDTFAECNSSLFGCKKMATEPMSCVSWYVRTCEGLHRACAVVATPRDGLGRRSEYSAEPAGMIFNNFGALSFLNRL